MSLFAKKPQDERGKKLYQYAQDSFNVLFMPVVVAIALLMGGKNIGNTFLLVLIAMAVVAEIVSLVRKGKLRRKLEEEAPLTEEELSYVKNFNKKRVIYLVAVVVIVGLLYVITDSSSTGSNATKKQHEETFGKDPNDWDEDDKRYVENLFDFIDGRK